MNVAQVLIFLSEPQRMDEFLDSINNGGLAMLGHDIKDLGFGASEWAIAAAFAGQTKLQELDRGEQDLQVSA